MNDPIFIDEEKKRKVINQISLPPLLLLMNNWPCFNE